jgi:hypothetical protein
MASCSGFARRVVVILAPLVAAAAVLPVLMVALRARLPGEAVVSPGREAVPWTVLATVTAGWLVAGTATLCWWLYRHRLSPVGVRWPAPFTWAGGAAVALRSVAVVIGNLDGARAIRPPWWAGPAATAVIAVAAAGLGWILAGRDPVPADASTGPAPDAPRLDLRPQQRAMWYRSVSSRHAFGIAGLLAVAAAVGLSTEGLGAVGALAAAAAAGVALQASVRVRVDRQAVTVTQPLLGRALITLPYRQIQQAYAHQTVTGLPARAYGVVAAGPVFGYRSRRTGSALRLHLADGRDCILTVDDATTAAALVNTYLDHRRTPDATQDDAC